ncbi:activator of HSP90 ATPase [Planotetraspora thailandica]|uniref:Activator of HSP90 ATPase n=1 Tax=Planotetraspora thailandica TaxID=487172 RepID=A0A8J3UYQ6_9ACTN|nr:SRPBCC family protein [Planotetraspora thailandica]GII51916.1 activator of HSP90 ATPase [Planotetraspora thailandica]
MSDRSVTHTTLTFERVYAVSPARVFAAWTDPGARARWFATLGNDHEIDFRVGGKEIVRGPDESGTILTFESVYHEIVVDRRIVSASVLYSGQIPATVSLTTVELWEEGDGTRLLLTEQGAFLDGHEQPAWREQGIAGQLSALDQELLGS